MLLYLKRTTKEKRLASKQWRVCASFLVGFSTAGHCLVGGGTGYRTLTLALGKQLYIDLSHSYRLLRRFVLYAHNSR